MVLEQKPVLVVAELALRTGDLCPVIQQLRSAEETAHVPILAYGDPKNQKLVDAAVAAGAKLVAAEAGILDQLPQLIEHLLEVE
jgi:PleD family two-component response regulator